jgi:hypothetical protein
MKNRELLPVREVNRIAYVIGLHNGFNDSSMPDVQLMVCLLTTGARG